MILNLDQKLPKNIKVVYKSFLPVTQGYTYFNFIDDDIGIVQGENEAQELNPWK